MELKEYVLRVCNNNEWLTGREIQDRILEERFTLNDWGPVSSIIAWWSPERARDWFDFMGGDRGIIYVAIESLCAEGYLESQIQEFQQDGIQRNEYRLTGNGSRQTAKTEGDWVQSCT